MSMMDISVVMPCYTAKVGTYVKHAVASILKQRGDFSLREIIVVDENEPNTKECLGDTLDSAVVKIVPNAGARNAAGARNTGLDLAKGEWIAFMDADDVLMDESLAIRCETARQFPDCRWVGADFYWMRENGEPEAQTFYASRPLPQRYFAEAFRTGLPVRLSRPVVPFLHACLSKIGANLIGRDLLDRVGPTDSDLKMSEDHQLYMRMAAISDYVFIPKPAMYYRRHQGNTTAAMDAGREAPGLWPYQALQQLLDRYGMQSYRRAIHAQMAYFALGDSYFYRKVGDRRASMKWAVQAIKLDPVCGAAWRSLAASLVGR
jgi:glycosyltransferase involved in cell wall biosynthesis